MRKCIVGGLLCLAVLPASASAQATRTWVSGTGDDANPCSRTAPCKTFAGSISKTASDGIINAIDSGGYGTVTITKGITIDGTGTAAEILASGGVPGVTVNAPGQDVVLRNLEISGTGTTCGTRGVWLRDARSLTVEGVRIDHFTEAGIKLAPATGSSTVAVHDTSVRLGCGTTQPVGISIAPAAGYTVSAMVDGVTLTNLNTALSVGDGGTAYLSNSEIFGNVTGLFTSGSGVIDDDGDNHVYGNTTDGSPTTRADPEVGPTGPAGAPGVAGSPGSTGPAGPAGVVSPRTAAVQIGKVTCKLGTHRKITCKVNQAKTRSSSARLTKAGRTVARGAGVDARTVHLTATRSLRHGSYVLTLRIGGTAVRVNVRL